MPVDGIISFKKLLCILQWILVLSGALYRKSIMIGLRTLWLSLLYKSFFWPTPKGQLISKGYFDCFNSPKNRTKNFCPSRLGHGLLNRWTDIFILPQTPWGLTFNPKHGTKTQSIFVKISENIFLGMSKVRAWLIFTLSMP